MDANSTRSRNTDWTKCCLCQEVKNEDLKSPQTKPVRKGKEDYMSLERDISQFQSMNDLPIDLDPKRLDDGSGIEETLRKNKAQYHESCRLLLKELLTSEKRSSNVGASDEEVLGSCESVSRLPISSPNRLLELQDLNKHEIQTYPESLSDDGKLRVCQKSKLVNILEERVNVLTKERYNHNGFEPKSDTIIIDGSALIHASPPEVSKTFNNYAKENIIPQVGSYCKRYKRVDIVFDVYKELSLKSETREKRGQGIRKKVTKRSKTPEDWDNFLRHSSNTTELFYFLADKMCEEVTTSTLIITKGNEVISNTAKSLDAVSPCCHEEADSRIFVHAMDATTDGSKSIIIKVNDTDVVVIAISVLPSLQEQGLQEMWICFNQGKCMRWIPVHDVVSAIGLKKARGIPYFHAFTGCDTVSAFFWKGKKSAWKTWEEFDDITETFINLSTYPIRKEDLDMEKLERFVVLMYDKSSKATGVDEARTDMFIKKKKGSKSIPPSQVSLREHAKRAAYQAGIIWGQATICNPEMSSPAEWGWKQEGNRWQIIWATPPIAASNL